MRILSLVCILLMATMAIADPMPAKEAKKISDVKFKERFDAEVQKIMDDAEKQVNEATQRGSFHALIRYEDKIRLSLKDIYPPENWNKYKGDVPDRLKAAIEKFKALGYRVELTTYDEYPYVFCVWLWWID